MSKELQYLVLHCTDTKVCRSVSRQDLEQWHLVENGWSRLGYSDMIHTDGNLENLIPYNDDEFVDTWERSNGVGKQVDGEWVNHVARHCVLVGGRDCKGKRGDTRTKEQRITLPNYFRMQIAMVPDIMIAGHYQFDEKKHFCPGFDVVEYCRSLGIPDKNIYIPMPDLKAYTK